MPGGLWKTTSGCSVTHAQALRAAAQELGIKAGQMFQPIRVAVCGRKNAPPLFETLEVLGRETVLKRIEQAVLDVTAQSPLIEENIPTSMEVHTRQGHPFRWLHGPMKDPYIAVKYGEQLGLGTTDYELVDVLPVEGIQPVSIAYIPAVQ